MIDTKALRAFRALVKLFTAKFRYFAPVRYRVVQKVADRYQVQAVRKGKWPDLTYVDVMPGAAGYGASLALGSIVVVQFLEGDPTLPVVTHFAGPGQEGFIPISVALAGEDAAVALVGSIVTVSMPPALPVSGTVSGAPFTGVITLPGTMIGSVQSGSSKVKAGR